MSGNLEGRIDIRLTRRGNTVAGVEIRSSRPQLAQRLMAGRSPEEAAELAGMVFSLCGKAQRIAVQAACGAARGQADGGAVSRERDARVLMELAQEHAWRLLLDWPQQAGLPPDKAALLALRQGADDPAHFAETLAAQLHAQFLGEPPAAWLDRVGAEDLAGFDAWRQAGQTLPARLFAGLGQGADVGISHAPLLPNLVDLEGAASAELARRALAQPDFCARPLWSNVPAETGALARELDHPLLAAWIARRGRGTGARLLARLLELAELPRWLQGECAPGEGPPVVRAQALGENVGMAAVETSRGLLIHVARLENDRVADYRIVAPTEWNFHPAGPLAQALAGLAAAGDLEARARLVAQSLDPCVAFGLEVRDV